MADAEGKTGQKNPYSLKNAVIVLIPALGCPGLVDDGKIRTVVLLRDRNLATSEYLADCLRYLPWDQKDGAPASGQKFQPQDITIRNYATEFSPYNYMSPMVLNAYHKMGFTQVVYATCKAPSGDGLYNLVTFYDESRAMRQIIEALTKPYDDCPMLPDKGVNSLNGKPIKLYHPFLVSQEDYLDIAHVTDPHLALRWELLDKRASARNITGINNYNKRFVEFLGAINGDSRMDIVLMTGDLIDYNRGHNGTNSNNLFTDYQFNRNWVMFYDLLVANYKKPVFTITGNHDYRLNPYAPMPRLFGELYSISFDLNLLRSEVRQIHENVGDIETGKDGNLYTTYESVAWYLLVINPLFDYTMFYKNMAFIMFDWCREEDLEDNLPWSENCLSAGQRSIFNRWLATSQGKMRVLGIHAPVYNPFPEIGNTYLEDGNIYKDSSTLMKIKIFKEWTDNRNELVDGTFRKSRNELIKRILDNSNYDKNGNHTVGPEPIHLVITGHAHRNGIYQVVGDRVKLTQRGNNDHWKQSQNLPIFVNSVSAGPLGFDNETGYSEAKNGLRHRYLVKPGYRNILFDSSGKVQGLEKKESAQVTVRPEVDVDFKEG